MPTWGAAGAQMKGIVKLSKVNRARDGQGKAKREFDERKRMAELHEQQQARIAQLEKRLKHHEVCTVFLLSPAMSAEEPLISLYLRLKPRHLPNRIQKRVYPLPRVSRHCLLPSHSQLTVHNPNPTLFMWPAKSSKLDKPQYHGSRRESSASLVPRDEDGGLLQSMRHENSLILETTDPQEGASNPGHTTLLD